MADETRNFVLRENGNETDSVFSGRNPRQAAVKAARRVTEPQRSESAAEADPTELRLRERGTDRVHVYHAWSWERPLGSGDPDWLSDPVTESNVSKQGVEHDEDF